MAQNQALVEDYRVWTEEQKDEANRKTRKAFKQGIKDMFMNGHKISSYTEIIGNVQSSYTLMRRNGVDVCVIIEGPVATLPICARAKRPAAEMEGGEAEEEVQEAHVFNTQETAAAASLRKGKASPRKNRAAPKKRKVAVPAAAEGARRDNAAPTRRSTRTSAAAAASASATRFTSRNVFQGDAIPEEGEYRFEPTVKDEDQDLTDMMNQFELASNAGSDSTRVFSREPTMEEPYFPVASTSRTVHVGA